jgi:hypothetical protein
VADSFGAVLYIDSQGEQPHQASLGPTFTFTIEQNYARLGPTEIVYPKVTAPNIFGPTLTHTLPQFALGLFFMGQLIQATDASNINVTTLTLSDKTGTGNMIVQPPAGASYQFRGMRLMTENRTSDYEIARDKSGYIWTNNGGAAMTCTLPANAPQGFAAYIVRTGGAMTITPGASEKIELGDNTNVKPNGSSVVLSTSGAILGLVKDDGTRWTRFISFGTVT